MFVAEAGLEPEQALALLKRAAEHKKAQNEVEAARFLAKAVAFAEGEEKGKLALEAATLLKNHDLQEALRLAEIALKVFPGKVDIIDLLIILFARLKQRDKAKAVMSLLNPEENQGEKGLHRQLRLYSLFNDHQASLGLVAEHPDLLESNDAEVLDDLIWTMIYLGQGEKAKELIRHALALPELTAYQRSRIYKP
jgi:tetratricopeptide (TPR) repeat protein